MLKANFQAINMSMNNISIKSNSILREKSLGWEFCEVGSWSGLFPSVGYRSESGFYQESDPDPQSKIASPSHYLWFLKTHLKYYITEIHPMVGEWCGLGPLLQHSLRRGHGGRQGNCNLCGNAKWSHACNVNIRKGQTINTAVYKSCLFGLKQAFDVTLNFN